MASVINSLSDFNLLSSETKYAKYSRILNTYLLNNKDFKNNNIIFHHVFNTFLEKLTSYISDNFDFFHLSEEEFLNNREATLELINSCYFLFDIFLTLERNQIALNNLLYIKESNENIFSNIFTNIKNIILYCFENILNAPIFLISSNAKQEFLEEIDQKYYPYFYNLFFQLSPIVEKYKNEFLKSLIENLNQNSIKPPITKMSTKLNESSNFIESTIEIKPIKSIEKKPISTIKNDSDSIGQFMEVFKFEELSEPRKKVLTNAYETLKLNLIEPAGNCKLEDCLFFIINNENVKGISSFISFVEKEIIKITNQYFSIDYVEKQLYDESTLENKTIYVNWFSFHEESPYEKLVSINKDILTYSKDIFSMNRTQIREVFQKYKDSNNSDLERSNNLNILKKYFSIGYFIEPGLFFSRNDDADLFEKWNYQITNMSKQDYEYNKNNIIKICSSYSNNKNFKCSNSFPWCGMVVSYWFDNVLDNKDKSLGYDNNGKLNWNSTIGTRNLLSTNKKRIITDVKKIKPGDVFIQKTQHFLVVFDIRFFKQIVDGVEEDYVQFYFIHGNCSGWHPFLEKYLEGIVIDGPSPDFDIYLKFDLWNKKRRAGNNKKIFKESDVMKNFWIFNVIGD